jgi:predicted CxxxxCH...CXXCH cytochrome family protein
VVFAGNLVGAQGATVAPWDRTKATCANYCHGGFTNGNKVPVSWTSTAAMTCNSCHGATPGATASLPGGTHPQGRADCSLCHPGSTTTTVNAASHLNGQFDVITLSCTSCHGDPARAGTALEQAAPPIDASGRTARSDLTVGAHQPHLAGGVPCSTCHEIPAAGDRTHAVPPFATVIFSGNRVGANGTPVAPWDRTQATCANYCHNGFAHGGTLPTPVWNQTTSLSCGACHWDQQSALTASGLHLLHVRDLLAPATPLDCGACHGAGYSKAGVTGAATTTHADTLLEVLPLVGWEDPRCVGTGPRTCAASCHNAPPLCRNWP